MDINFVDFGEDVFAGKEFSQHLSVYQGLTTIRGKGVSARVLAWPAGDIIAIEIQDDRQTPSAISIDLRMLRYAMRYSRGRNYQLATNHTVLIQNRRHTAASTLKTREGRILLSQEFREGDYHDSSALIVSVIGRRDGIPAATLAEMDKTVEMSAANTGTRLCLAINYGSRGEIVDAVRKIAEEVRDGNLQADAIDEQTIADHLYSAGMPDPDLLIRTAGEMRISNFLLWQISYAELWITDKCWPEFEIADFHQAIRDFAARDRRFGGIKG